ncbi:hypothetical protein [Weissella confusa]|uniref:hypothetical protein n=1 Tax=Weissella confusa TaxID=1583 RepID=UPI0018989CAD|nr:hypothetical protein [Weissella confusa]MDY2522341.1 hypothetical protein [Weissella confusa]
MKKVLVSEHFLILTVAFFLYIIVALFYKSPVDLQNFNVPWARQIIEHHFNLYDRSIVPKVDYPPVMPTLYALFYKVFVESHVFAFLNFDNLTNLALKMPSIFVTFAFAIWGYLKKVVSPGFMLYGILLNPVFIVNTTMWGQSDIVLVVLAFLAFYYLNQKKNPILGSFWMGIAVVTKLQAVYLLPIFLVALLVIEWRDIRKLFLSLLTGALTILTIWMPMIIMNDVTLPVRTYLSGAGSYTQLALSSFNIWQIVSLKVPNLTTDTAIFRSFTISDLNYLILGALVIISSVLLIRKKNINLVGFGYLGAVFVLTTSQHERYAIPSFAFIILLVAAKYSFSIFEKISLLILIFLMFLNETVVLGRFGGVLPTIPNRMLMFFSTAFIIFYSAWIFATILKNSKLQSGR